MWSQSACSIVGHDKEQQTMLVSGQSDAVRSLKYLGRYKVD
jgi:hypothetical protein